MVPVTLERKTIVFNLAAKITLILQLSVIILDFLYLVTKVHKREGSFCVPEDKTTYPIQVSGSNYKTNALFVNESGLYALILSSKLPQAKGEKKVHTYMTWTMNGLRFLNAKLGYPNF